nr:SNF2 helicase associated domain-containing protein [Lactobacillus amylovorus]
MTQDSKKWLDFIAKIIDARNLSVYYGGTSHFNTIEIENSIADEVNDLIYNGTKLYSGAHLVGYTSDQLYLKIDISDDKGGAIVTIEDFPAGTIIAGRDSYYGYYKGVWIKYTGLTPHYLQRLKIHPGDELRFSKKTIVPFARKVLPTLEQANHISITGAQELKAKLPPKARFIFKLDYLNGKIRCNALVLYGDAEYQLNRDYTSATQRENELEESVENELKQYFTDFDQGQFLLPNDDADAIADFFDNGLKKIKELGEVQITANFRSLLKGIKINNQIGVSINLTNELLDIDLTSQKLSWEDIQAALKAYQEKKRYFILQNGMLQTVEQPTIEQLAQT